MAAGTLMDKFVCAVDVGTGSARAGIFDGAGRLAGRAEHPILLSRPSPAMAEHDSEDIWAAACAAVRGALEKSGVAPQAVAGIGFDATCSLVVRGPDGRQVTVSETGEARWDTISWLDHRALAEADECTVSGHRVLDHVGGVMSPEMQVPKLMWLKRHLPRSWDSAGYFFDLTDFLTFRASGSSARSQGTLTCKWTYLAHEDDGWQRDFFEAVGVPDILERGRLPERPVPGGTDLGPLTPEAAAGLGLTTGCRVAAGLIDAYAGALGVFAGHAGNGDDLDRRLALIAGTSSCVMSMTATPRRFAGGWGPYYGAALPDLWLSEGGQSATGALLDHVIRWHGAAGDPDAETHRRIAARITALREAGKLDGERRLHVLPDFHGNRSPFADPHATGVISGLTLDASFDSLCRLYWRSCVGIALGVRHILDSLEGAPGQVDTLHITGGHTRNPIMMSLYADATGCSIAETAEDEAVLLGTAMLAAAAAGLYPTLRDTCAGMRQPARVTHPDPAARESFTRDYQIFLEMHKHRKVLDALSAGANPPA